MNSVQYVGMDVDKEKIILARLGAGNAKEVQEHVIANTPNAVKKYFTALLGRVQDESVRDYLRMYEDLRGDLRICN